MNTFTLVSELPIISTVAAFHGLLLIILSMRVGIVRFRKKIWLLDGEDKELTRTLRVQGNFTEYVPMALLLLALLEISGASGATLWALSALLICSRLVHAFSLSRSTRSIGRGLGANGTFLVLAASSVLLLWRIWS